MIQYLVDFEIEHVDAWHFYYENYDHNFKVEAIDGKVYEPVFMFDKDNCPTDFMGWNYAK